jgi:hypothetical protein
MGIGQKDKDHPPGVSHIKGDQNIVSGNISSGGIVVQGRGARVSVQQTSGVTVDEISTLFDKLYQYIETRPPDPDVDKEEIVETIQKVQEEVSGEGEPNETKLTRWMDNLSKMAPDVVDVVLASLGGPVSGTVAVLKKIADRSHQQ